MLESSPLINQALLKEVFHADMQREIMNQREYANVAKQEASEAKQEANGAKRKIFFVVQKMRSKGMTTEDICEITGLSKEEVEAVIRC